MCLCLCICGTLYPWSCNERCKEEESEEETQRTQHSIYLGLWAGHKKSVYCYEIIIVIISFCFVPFSSCYFGATCLPSSFTTHWFCKPNSPFWFLPIRYAKITKRITNRFIRNVFRFRLVEKPEKIVAHEYLSVHTYVYVVNVFVLRMFCSGVFYSIVFQLGIISLWDGYVFHLIHVYCSIDNWN